jgi:hypothetical protein
VKCAAICETAVVHLAYEAQNLRDWPR